MILKGLLGDGRELDGRDQDSLTGGEGDRALRLERALRRRLERTREPQVSHPIVPLPAVRTEYPAREQDRELAGADVARRSQRRRTLERDMHRRIAKNLDLGGMDPMSGRPPRPRGMKTRHGNLRPVDFPGRPVGGGHKGAGRGKPASPGARETARGKRTERPPGDAAQSASERGTVVLGDSLAARAGKLYKSKQRKRGADSP